MGAHAKVSHSLSRVSGSSHDDGVLSLGGSSSQLVKGDGLSASLDDSGSSSLGESQSSNSHLGHLQESGIVSNGSHHHKGLVGSTRRLGNPGNSRH